MSKRPELHRPAQGEQVGLHIHRGAVDQVRVAPFIDPREPRRSHVEIHIRVQTHEVDPELLVPRRRGPFAGILRIDVRQGGFQGALPDGKGGVQNIVIHIVVVLVIPHAPLVGLQPDEGNRKTLALVGHRRSGVIIVEQKSAVDHPGLQPQQNVHRPEIENSRRSS